jgi:DNA polymerase IV (DinB-like DNA polymerase)
MEILSRFADRCEPVSIDEAYLDITGSGSYPAAVDLARQIKEEIREKEQLSCSVGIGPGKIVAKIASGFSKPDGLTVVDPDHVHPFLSPLPVEQVPGIGRKTAAVLNEMGIVTIGQLAEYDIQALASRFGKGGLALRMLARGEDDREVQVRGSSRSISREHTFTEDTRDPLVLTHTLDTMADMLHAALGEEGLRFRTVTVKVRYEGFITRTKSRSLAHHSTDPARIKILAHSLLAEFPLENRIRLIGLRLSGFDQKSAGQRTIGDYCGGEENG